MKHALSAALGLVALTLSGSSRAEGDLVLELGGGTSLELKRIPKGTFVQGSPPTDLLREPDETARTVNISHDFWLGKTPVTKGQFARFVSETRYITEAEKGPSGGHGWDGKQLYQKKDYNWKNTGFPQTMEDPVVLVSFADASAFTAWLARKTGRRVRLPSEAEWEYSARAGTSTPWYGGAKDDDALAIGWFVKNAGQGTHPVGQKKPNAFGLFDMSGDVYQWCRDVYAPYPPGNAVDPENSAHANAEEKRVLRGGSWLRDPRRGRSSSRFRSGPGSRSAEYGFRVAAHDEDALAPGAPAGSAEFAPAAPLGLGSSSPGTAPLPGGDASADATAPSVRPTPEGTGWSLLVAPAGAAAAVVLWMLVRRKRSRVPASAPATITTRAENDGFWVSAPSLSAGARVRYTCIVGGAEVTDVVPTDSADETFVYTGGRPSAIRVVETFAATRGGYRTSQPTQPAAPPPPPSSSGSGLTPPSSSPSSPRRPPPVPTSSSKIAAASPPPVPTSSSKIAAAPPPSSRRNEDLPPEPIEPESIETIEPPPVIVPTVIQTIEATSSIASEKAPPPSAEKTDEAEASSLEVPPPPSSANADDAEASSEASAESSTPAAVGKAATSEPAAEAASEEPAPADANEPDAEASASAAVETSADVAPLEASSAADPGADEANAEASADTEASAPNAVTPSEASSPADTKASEPNAVTPSEASTDPGTNEPATAPEVKASANADEAEAKPSPSSEAFAGAPADAPAAPSSEPAASPEATKAQDDDGPSSDEKPRDT